MSHRNSPATPPRRRIVVKLELDADSWEDVSRALEDLSRDVASGGMRGIWVSRGSSTGYVWEASEDESITHDSFVVALLEYLHAGRARPSLADAIVEIGDAQDGLREQSEATP